MLHEVDGSSVSLWFSFSLGTVDFSGAIIPCRGGNQPVLYRMPSSISAVYSLDASSTLPVPLPVLTNKNLPRHCQVSPGGKQN